MIKYFLIKGRINRRELFALTAVVLLLEFIACLIFRNKSDILIKISILLFVFYLMQCAKRFHDINKSAINGFLWWIVPIINLVYFFQLYFSKGNDRRNKYGEPSSFRVFRRKQFDNTNNIHIKHRKNNSLGVFTVKDFPRNVRSEKFYLNVYCKGDGEWIKKGEPICKIRVGDSSGYRVKSGTVIATKSGVLEWTVEEGSQLAEKMILYKLHAKGVYEKENTIDNDEYRHYYSDQYKRRFVAWLVSDGSYVKEGEEIYKYKDRQFNELIHKAEKTGYIHIVEPAKIYLYEENELLYYIRNNDSQRVIDKYKNTPLIIEDDFTQSKSILWDRISTNSRLGYGIISKSDDGLVDLNFTLNYLQNEDKIIFHFISKEVKPVQNDKVSFLFENGELIEFCLNSNPISIVNPNRKRVLEYQSSITKTELNLFVNEVFKKWKIELLSENREILGGERGSIIDYELKDNLIIVIKKFAADYRSTVLANILDYEPIETREVKVNTDIKDNECYVYLMHDTSNDYYKIGISNKPYYRERTLQSEKPTIELIASKRYPVRKIAESFEKSLHSVYDDKRLRGEWFELDEYDVNNIIESLK